MPQNKLDYTMQANNHLLSTQKKRILTIIQILQEKLMGFPSPASELIVKKFTRDPFLILIGCILSLRTRDTTSEPAACRLFEHAVTPEAMLTLDISFIEKLIYPVGFYRRKAAQTHEICKQLISNFSGKVPNTQQELLSLPGVGLKTANLVLWEGFRIPAICVDTHVHRISNRLGLVTTKTPDETEKQLRLIVPKEFWGEINRLFVQLGQNICVPLSPKCSTCPLFNLCPRIDVTKSR